MSQASAGLSVNINPSDISASGGYTKQTINDHFVTTEKTLSGLYGGSDGIGVDVAGNTTLKAGVISSTADGSKNHLTTAHLTAEDEQNSSVWKAVSVGGQGSIGSNMFGSSLGQLGMLAKNMAANSLGMLGGGRSHDEHSVSQSAISGNVTIQAQSQSGHYLTDVSQANGALENKFDAQKLQNQIQSARVGSQLVGEALGGLSESLRDSGVPGFSETELSDSWGRTLLEAGGNAGIAALTGGNAGAAAAGSVLGNVAATASRDAVSSFASSLTGDKDSNETRTLANAMSSIIASGAGAAGGLVAGGGNTRFNALNGAAAASALEQYNAEEHMTVEGKRQKTDLDNLTDNGLALGAMIPGPIGASSSMALGLHLISEGNYGMGALSIILGIPDIVGIDTSAISGGLVLAEGAVRAERAARATDATIEAGKVVALANQAIGAGEGVSQHINNMDGAGGGSEEASSEKELQGPWLKENGESIGEKGEKFNIRIMEASENPEKATQDFIDEILEGKEIEKEGEFSVRNEDRSIGEKKGYSIKTKDGLSIYSRAPGNAGKKTPDNMGAVELHVRKGTIGAGQSKFKFKFPGVE